MARKGTYIVKKRFKAPYFRWDYPKNLGRKTISDITEEAADAAFSFDPKTFIDVTGMASCKDGPVVLAADNLSDEGSRYQPSSKHLYVIPQEIFNNSVVEWIEIGKKKRHLKD